MFVKDEVPLRLLRSTFDFVNLYSTFDFYSFDFIVIRRVFVLRVLYRSSRPEVLCKKDFLRNFTKFTGKHLCQSLFLNKLAGLSPVTLLKKRLWHRCFPVNFVKFLRTPFYIEHLWWLLLTIVKIIICN